MIVNQSVFNIISPELHPFISNYYLFEFSNETAESIRFKVPPTGFPTLLFCYGNKINFFQHKHLTNESIIVGQLSKHVNLYPVDGTKLFGVNFKPYGFYNLTGVSLKGLVNGAIESTAIFPEAEIEAIDNCFQLSPNRTECMGSLEALLLKTRVCVRNNNFLDRIVDEILERNGLIDPYSLTHGKISARSFQRYFNEVIGINPKLFCQILRHKFILQQLYENPGLTWNEMVHNGYYYDYSHFQKDFIKFTGVKPFEYLQLKNPFAGKLL